MKLTEEEKELILKLRANKRSELPIKTAKLKHDLFSGFREIKLPCWYVTKEEIERTFKTYSPTILEKKNTIFECYLFGKDECWYDTGNGKFPGMDSHWAKEHLTDVKVLRRPKIEDKDEDEQLERIY